MPLGEELLYIINDGYYTNGEILTLSTMEFLNGEMLQNAPTNECT